MKTSEFRKLIREEIRKVLKEARVPKSGQKLDDYNNDDESIETAHIYLRNINTEEQICIYAEDFIYTLDYHDITILQNNDRCLFYDQK